jgi:hypothetical protein
LLLLLFLLLVQQEWEEKLNQAQEQADMYKRKYDTVKDGKETSLMEEARNAMSQNFPQKMQEQQGNFDGLGALGGSIRSTANRPEFQKGVESVASMGSSLAHHAKTLVGSFACAGNNERTGQVLVSERATEEWRDRRNAAAAQQQLPNGLEMSDSNTSYPPSRSYRETASSSAQAPRHVDV